MERIAAVDLGTNSIRLAVADVLADHTLSIVREAKEVIRLGQGESGGLLAEDAIERAATACRGFADISRQLEADPIIAVATSAVREAKNRDAVLARLREASGLNLHVISGEEEGRLIHLGVVHNEALPPGRVVVIDIGGGSAEITSGDRDGVESVESLKLGAIRTTQAQPPDAQGRYGRERLDQLREYSRNTSLRAVQRLRLQDIRTVVGTSGTIQNLYQITRRDEDAASHPFLQQTDLTKLINRMAKLTTSERAALPGINPERADIIVAGAVVLEQVLIGLKQPGVRISERTLRDGLLLDYVLRAESARDTYGTTPVRERSVMRMLRRFRAEEEHALQVAKLADSLFDQCRELGWHSYGEEQRELLRYGAMLHDVGVIISPSAHHKHGHYLVSSVPLPGFHQDESDVLAALAWFHRKAMPKPSHPVIAALRPAGQEFVIRIMPLLRLADALDRSHIGAVCGVMVEEGRHGDAEVTALSEEPIPYETWAVERLLTLSPALFGHPIRFHTSR